MITFRKDKYQTIAISLLVHALLLVLLTMYVIKPMVAPRWYEFDLATPETDIDEAITDSGPGALQTQAQASPASPVQTKTANKPQVSQPEKAVVKSTEPIPQSSELLETPAMVTNRETASASLPNNPLNPLRGIPTGRSGNQGLPGGTVNYSLTGGRVSFQLPAGYKHSLGAAGSATLKFRLDKNARPIESSIESMEQSGPRYFDEAKKVLQQGRFSFTGSPNSNAEYTITFNFII